MTCIKYTLIMLIGICALTANAQRTKEEVIGRLMTDQKKWHQSKMPVVNYYKDNHVYKIPQYNLGSNYLANHSDQHVMFVEKSKLIYNYNIPFNRYINTPFYDSVWNSGIIDFFKRKELQRFKYSPLTTNSLN